LPSRLARAWKQVLGPSAVMVLALYRAAILLTVDLCLAGRVGCPARSLGSSWLNWLHPV